MIQFKRRNTLWLAAMSVLMALVMISGNVAGEVIALFFGVWVLAVMSAFINLNTLPARTQSLIQNPINRSRMSPQAREAVSRASSRMGYRSPSAQLIDVGLIASQSGPEGMTMRRTRSISKDDDGVRPFVTLHVTPEQADRNVLIRYEIIDQNGREQYIYEMKVYLRDGEMNILADNHLPLRSNQQIAGMGNWDLRVLVDGNLAGIHNFALTASTEERRRRLSGNEYYVTGQNSREMDDDDDSEDIPLSLEELLRNQSSSNRN
ncbi:MAG: hypothetical protein OHK0046_12330 [Anaerolineae bacterium]